MPTRDQFTGKISVAGTQGGNGSFPSLPSAGSPVFVELAGANIALDFSDLSGDVVDNQGNNYTLAIKSALNNRGRCAIFFCPNIGTPSGTFTITVSTASGVWDGEWSATSFTGMPAPVTLDQSTSATGTSANPSSGATATTTQADEVVAGVMQIRVELSSLTVEVLSPAWVQESEELSFVTSEPGECDTRIVTATAAMTANWTASSSGTWTAAIATFKAGGAAATDQIHYMTPGTGWPRRVDRVRVQ